MKKSLKYIDLILLRIIPTLFLIFTALNNIIVYFQAGAKIESYTFVLFVTRFFPTISLVLLGLVAILKYFDVLKKLTFILKYSTAIISFIYIIMKVYDKIQTMTLSAMFGSTPQFFGFLNILPNAENIVYIVGFIIIFICCLLSDKFAKLKWGLCITAAALYFGECFFAPIYTLVYFNDSTGLILLFNSILPAYCYSSVIITGLYPKKRNDKI